MKTSRILVLIVTIVTILCCLTGILYNAATMKAALSGAFEKSKAIGEQPYFYQAFYLMSAICILFYLSLLVCSIDFLRGYFRSFIPIIVIFIGEVVYYFAIGFLWLNPKLGQSVAAATGVANGGLMIQFIIALPIWAPILLFIAKRKQNI